MPTLDELLEAERRGLLPAHLQALLSEARGRGLLPSSGPTLGERAGRLGQQALQAGLTGLRALDVPRQAVLAPAAGFPMRRALEQVRTPEKAVTGAQVIERGLPETGLAEPSTLGQLLARIGAEFALEMADPTLLLGAVSPLRRALGQGLGREVEQVVETAAAGRPRTPYAGGGPSPIIGQAAPGSALSLAIGPQPGGPLVLPGVRRPEAGEATLRGILGRRGASPEEIERTLAATAPKPPGRTLTLGRAEQGESLTQIRQGELSQGITAGLSPAVPPQGPFIVDLSGKALQSQEAQMLRAAESARSRALDKLAEGIEQAVTQPGPLEQKPITLRAALAKPPAKPSAAHARTLANMVAFQGATTEAQDFAARHSLWFRVHPETGVVEAGKLGQSAPSAYRVPDLTQIPPEFRPVSPVSAEVPTGALPESETPVVVKSATKRGIPMTARAINDEDPLAQFIVKRGGFDPKGVEGEVEPIARGRGTPPGLFRSGAQLGADELAEEAFQAGYIESPTTNALIQGLTNDINAVRTSGRPWDRVLSHKGKELYSAQRFEAEERAAMQAEGEGIPSFFDEGADFVQGPQGPQPAVTGERVTEGRTLRGEAAEFTFGKETGAAPILNLVGEKAIKTGRAIYFPFKVARDRLLLNTTSVMRRGPEETGLLANMMEGVETRHERLAGRSQWLARQVTNRLTAAEKVNVRRSLDGRLTDAEKQTLTDKEVEAVKLLRGLYNEVRAVGRRLGVEQEVKPLLRVFDPEGTARPFLGFEDDYLPRWLKPAVFEEGSPLHNRLANWLTQNRNFTPDRAREMLQQEAMLSRRKAQRYGSLERGRTQLDLPEFAYEDRLEVINDLYFDRAFNRLQMIETFGPSNEKAGLLIDAAALKDPDAAAFARKVFNRWAHIDLQDTGMARALGQLTGFEAITKLTPSSSIAQISQVLSDAVRTNLKSTFKAIANFGASKEVATRAGVLLRSTRRDAMQDFLGAPAAERTLTERYLKWIGFNALDAYARIVGAGAGRFYADELAGKLLANPTSRHAPFWRRRLAEMGVDPDKVAGLRALSNQEGRMTTEYLDELVKAGQRTSGDANFRNTVLTLPDAFTTPAGRLFLQFKSFGLNQAKFIVDSVFREALRGNFAPAATMLVGGGLLGEVVADLRSLARARDPSDPGGRGGIMAKGLGARQVDASHVLYNYLALGAFGLFQDVYDAALYGPDAIQSFVTGPAVGDLIDAFQAVQASVRRADLAPLARFAVKEFTPASGTVGRPLAEALFPRQQGAAIPTTLPRAF